MKLVGFYIWKAIAIEIIIFEKNLDLKPSVVSEKKKM